MIAKLVQKFLQSPEMQAKVASMQADRARRDQSVNNSRQGFTDVAQKPDEEALKRIRAQLAGRAGRF